MTDRDSRPPGRTSFSPGTGFDIIGDVHGCKDELEELLTLLRYTRNGSGHWQPPPTRIAVFVGDLVDRGPKILETVLTVMAMVDAGTALAVPGNHDLQLVRHLESGDVPIVHGLETTVEETDRETPAVRHQISAFFQSLPGHYVLDEGRVVVAHTGLPEHLHGKETPDTRQLATYGVLNGEPHPTDRSKRHPWVATYRGEAVVVYGHTPTRAPVWLRNTIDIDTGCVFGGRLTALQWPERTLVSVAGRDVYAPPPPYF